MICYLLTIILFLNSFINEHKEVDSWNYSKSKMKFEAPVTFKKNELQTKVLDTITNWQFYKDKELLFKSNFIDSNRFCIEIKTSDKYENLILNMFHDFSNEILERKIELICENKTIIFISDKNQSRLPFKIPKSEIDKISNQNYDQDIYIKYFDKINKNGIILGILKIIEV